MVADNEKKAKATSAADDATESDSVQERVLDAIKRSQEATLQAVSTWSEQVSKMVYHLPELPKLPIPEALTKPGELSDQFFDFAQRLMKSQQEFAKKLVDTLAHHEKTDD